MRLSGPKYFARLLPAPCLQSLPCPALCNAPNQLEMSTFLGQCDFREDPDVLELVRRQMRTLHYGVPSLPSRWVTPGSNTHQAFATTLKDTREHPRATHEVSGTAGQVCPKPGEDKCNVTFTAIIVSSIIFQSPFVCISTTSAHRNTLHQSQTASTTQRSINEGKDEQTW